MINLTVDLGQIALGILIGTIGWFIKREIINVGKRIDTHEAIIRQLADKVQMVLGYNQAVKELGLNRRQQGGTLDG